MEDLTPAAAGSKLVDQLLGGAAPGSGNPMQGQTEGGLFPTNTAAVSPAAGVPQTFTPNPSGSGAQGAAAELDVNYPPGRLDEPPLVTGAGDWPEAAFSRPDLTGVGAWQASPAAGDLAAVLHPATSQPRHPLTGQFITGTAVPR